MSSSEYMYGYVRMSVSLSVCARMGITELFIVLIHHLDCCMCIPTKVLLLKTCEEPHLSVH